MKNSLVLITLHLFPSLFCVEAQFPPANYTPQFQPSLGLVIGIFSGMFFLTFALLLYIKFFHRRASDLTGLAIHHGLPGSSSRVFGLDKTVVESLPFFRFSALKGSKQGLECAVCLSKFEDIEILRLLPKCKHCFHIDCIDRWLEKHANCPLCRQRVSSEDLKISIFSNSMRFLGTSQSELREDSSNLEIFVERERDDRSRGSCSSRFSIGSSFRKAEKMTNEKEMLIENGEEQVLHKHNHRIIVSDFVFKNRWSNVSSSDLMFLNSEMIASLSSNRFSSMVDDQTKGQKLVENEITRGSIQNHPSRSDSTENSRVIDPNEKRSASEITGLSRFCDLGMIKNKVGDSSKGESSLKEEKMREIWYPIARRTVKWFADREIRSHSSENKEKQEE